MTTESNVNALRALHAHLTSKIPEQHAAARQVAGEVGRLADLAGRLAELHSTPDPQLTPAAHFRRVANAADRLNKETTVTVNRILKIQGDGIDAIQARIRAKTKLQPDAYASEVRDMWRRAEPKERVALLTELIEQGRGSELAALISPVVPRSATGMTEEYRAKWEAAFIAKHAPDEMNEQLVLTATCEGAFVATKTAGQVAAAYTDPVKLAEITKAEAAAAKAAAAFDRTA